MKPMTSKQLRKYIKAVKLLADIQMEQTKSSDRKQQLSNIVENVVGDVWQYGIQNAVIRDATRRLYPRRPPINYQFPEENL